MTETRQQSLTRELREYIAEAFLYMHPEIHLADEDRFLELGVIDSLGFVELVDEVQTRYGVVVDDIDITEENFGSIAALARYVERKGGA